MTKNKKIALILTTIATALAIIAIFMVFAAGIKTKVSFDGHTETQTAKLSDILFDKDAKDAFKRHALVVVAFAALLVSILTLGTNCVLNLTKKANKNVNLIMLSIAIVLLVFSAIVMFAIAPVLGLNNKTIEGETLKYLPGAGAAVWGTFGLIAAGLTTGAVVLNSKEAKAA